MAAAPISGPTAGRVDVDSAILLVADGGLGDGLLWTLAGDARTDLVLPSAGRWIGLRALVVVVATVGNRATRVAVAGVTPDGTAIGEPDYAPERSLTLEPPASHRRERLAKLCARARGSEFSTSG